jgi:hypothetical protein
MNAPATLSTEGKIISNLAALRMNRKEFVGICQALSIPVSEALVSICLNGRREFSQWTGINLLAALEELLALKNHHGVALNWSSSEDIATLLVRRRMEACTNRIWKQLKR